MKKSFVAMAMFACGVLAVNADGLDRDRVITKEQLPESARSFMNEHFADNKISFVKEDRDFLSKNYEVVFADGTRLEFTRAGEWKEVDCRNSQVPAAILPDQIEKYVADNYAGEKILQIDRDNNDYEVRISNQLELTFDKNFNIIDIDD